MDRGSGKGGFSTITNYGLLYSDIWRGLHHRRHLCGHWHFLQRMEGIQKCVRHSASTPGRCPRRNVFLPLRSRNDSGRHFWCDLCHSRNPAQSHVKHDVRSGILYSVILSCLRHGVESLADLRDLPSHLPPMTSQDDFDPLLTSLWQPRS